jgi:tRNA(Arg) A34 adenosine deaminase TadA
MGCNRRDFLGRAAWSVPFGTALLTRNAFGLRKAPGEGTGSAMDDSRTASDEVAAFDEVMSSDAERMKSLAAWTMLSMQTDAPNPFGCDIVNTRTGERLMRAMNAVGAENDPSAHAEVRTMRLACAKLKSPSLQGYTLYTTCEPCPMCMSDALWAGIDRVVYGATIADANRFCKQIQIPAAEVAKRSDMVCVVDGPIERAACVELFTNPKMQAAFAKWTSRK